MEFKILTADKNADLQAKILDNDGRGWEVSEKSFVYNGRRKMAVMVERRLE